MPEADMGASFDDKIAKRQGSKQGEIPKSIRFPPNLSLSSDNFGDGTSNILAFTIYDYSGTGYQMANSDGKGRNLFTKSGEPRYFIYLSTPSEQGTAYSHDWSIAKQDLVMSALINAGSAFFSNYKGSFDMAYAEAVGGQLSESVEMVGQALLYNNIQKVLSDPKTGKILSRVGGISLSPYQEYLYQNPKFRAPFQFNFRLIPRNPSEIQTINDIIHLFKWASHPAISGLQEDIKGAFSEVGIDINAVKEGARILSYPNVFGIRYVINDTDTGLDDQHIGKDNPWLHKFGPCCCTSVVVKYSPGANNYVSYRSSKDYRFASDEGDPINPEGSPIYYDLTLQFQEMIILTKETINEGF